MTDRAGPRLHLARAKNSLLEATGSDLLVAGDDYVVYAESHGPREYRIVPGPDIPFLYPADAQNFHVLSGRPIDWIEGAGVWAPRPIAEDPTFFDALTEGDPVATRAFASIRKRYGDVSPSVGVRLASEWIVAVKLGLLSPPSTTAVKLGFRLQWFSPSWLAGTPMAGLAEQAQSATETVTDAEVFAARKYWADAFEFLPIGPDHV
jgi:hypothetical protein